MRTAARTARALVVAAVCSAASAFAQPPATPAPAPPPDADSLARFIASLEHVVESGTPDAYASLLAPSADRTRARDFAASEITPGTTRATIHERDRETLQPTAAGTGRRLLLEAFIESGPRARIVTWRIDVRRAAGASSDGWQIANEQQLSSVESLYHLSLDSNRQFEARNLTISAEDLEIGLPRGSVFVAGTDLGVTGLVLLGRGEMKFRPGPATERGQVKIFCGAETLTTAFDAVFVRLNPLEFERVVDQKQLAPRAVDPVDLRRADEVFRDEAPKSFSLDLGDLTRDSWWMLPQPGDFLAEIRTRRYGTLTYTRASSEAEDISLFDRKKRHNISAYTSADVLAQRGRFYSEDDREDFDVLDYDLDVSFDPERSWVDGIAHMRLQMRTDMASTLTIRLANPLVVRSIWSFEYGRLLSIRVRDQNTIVVSVPAALAKGEQLNLTITYGGRLEPQTPDTETAGQLGSVAVSDDDSLIVAERSWLYSSRSYWYPQNSVTDYATATLRITVPAEYDCVASGDLYPGAPVLRAGAPGELPRKFYVFTASRPSRYLGFIVSKFVRAETATVVLSDVVRHDEALTPPPVDSLQITVESNRRQLSHTRDTIERAADIARYYTSLLGDCPYPSFTVAVVERDLPGGHSPPYFAVLDQPLGTKSPSTWRNDPASFPSFPEFFLAHELAHQWWGQAVGWRNYHEQWLSEGMAQYFAALYAGHHGGNEALESLLRQFRRWSVEQSEEGPVYLGYRLGHIKGNSRIFRAIVYNKGAAVLHMLRLLVGDDAFFDGLRRFYRDGRFQKAGTDQLKAAMEKASGRDLGRFFDGWIFGSALPEVKFSSRVDGGDLVLRAEQVGELFDVPLPVTVRTSAGKPITLVMAVNDRVVEQRVALDGATVRGVDVDEDQTLARVDR